MHKEISFKNITDPTHSSILNCPDVIRLSVCIFSPVLPSLAVMVLLCVEISSAVLVSGAARTSLTGPLFRTGVLFSWLCWRPSLGRGFPFPLSPELVLPVRRRAMPFPGSWGLPVLGPPWISSFTLGTASLRRLGTLVLSRWGLEDDGLPPLEREG